MFRFDESNPRYLIAYEEAHEHKVEPYQELMRRWLARAERGDRFGVVLVTPIEDHEDDEHARDAEFEEAYTRFLNDFRRDHKADVERVTVGFARVLDVEFMKQQAAVNPHYAEEASAATDRTTRYLWGTPGSLFATVEEGLVWLEAQFANAAPPVPQSLSAPTQHRVGLFYGSTTGVTEMIAFEIAQAWAAQGMEPITPINIGMVKDLSRLLEYDCLILGIPTWNVGQLQDDWEIAFPQLDALDFSGKQIALFGVGDQYGYPDNYLDAMGTLGKKLIERGAVLVGHWSAEGYEFAASTAYVDGKFMGLALDEVHQANHSDRRIQQWIVQIVAEFALQPQA